MAVKIRFTNEGTVFTLPWDVAVEKGYFKEDGIEVEVWEPDPALGARAGLRAACDVRLRGRRP